jgi:hypothetical protein
LIDPSKKAVLLIKSLRGSPRSKEEEEGHRAGGNVAQNNKYPRHFSGTSNPVLGDCEF